MTEKDIKINFLREFGELLSKYNAYIEVEDTDMGYTSDEVIQVRFDWNEELCNVTGSGITSDICLGKLFESIDVNKLIEKLK